MKKIGIIGAMDVEVDAILSQTEIACEKEILGTKYVEGVLAGKNVVVAQCGIGKVSAARVAAVMLSAFKVDALINTGVAGSTGELCVGEIALSENAVEYDFDTTAFGDPLGMTDLGVVKIPASETLLAAAKDAAKDYGARFLSGTVASGDTFVADSETKAFLRENFGAICCEMEGAAIGHVAFGAGVPFLIVRAISDDGREDHAVQFEEFKSVAAKISAALVKGTLSRL